MSHLTDEQMEDILHGSLSESAHLVSCESCRFELAERRALSRRVRSAFACVSPDSRLAGDIRKRLIGESSPRPRRFFAYFSRVRFRRFALPAAAAAVLVVTVFLGVNVMPPPSAMAEMVEIHNHNISAEHSREFFSESSPVKLAEYFRSELGFSPSLPSPRRGLSLMGCCLRHFRGQIAGSYVVDTPSGVISIIVIAEDPEVLGIGSKFSYQGRVFWKGSFAKCDMVVVRLGAYSYCAVGEVSHEYLTELLSRLVAVD